MIANESFLSVASSQIAALNIYNIYFRLQSYRKSPPSSIKFVSYTLIPQHFDLTLFISS